MPSPEAVLWSFVALVAFIALVLWLLPTWARYYVAFRREGFGRGSSALRALSLTIVPLPRIE